jgi:hypothetical protein
MQFSKTMELQLKSGQSMEIQMTPLLIEKIKSSFSLNSVDDITEKHVKYYLAISMKNMLSEAGDGNECVA